MQRRGDVGRDKRYQDIIVKVILPKRDRVDMPRDERGNYIATVQGNHRYLSSQQPISRAVFDQIYAEDGTPGGYGYYIADYSPLLKMWILGHRMKPPGW